MPIEILCRIFKVFFLLVTDGEKARGFRMQSYNFESVTVLFKLVARGHSDHQ